MQVQLSLGPCPSGGFHYLLCVDGERVTLGHEAIWPDALAVSLTHAAKMMADVWGIPTDHRPGFVPEDN